MMGIYGELLGYENLEIVSSYPLQRLSELKLVRQLNCHTVLHYTGVIPEEKKDSYIEAATAQDTVAVNQKTRSGKTEALFKGIVADVGVKVAQGVYYLDVTAVSHTALMDVKLRSRSFQNQAMSYDALLTKVMQSYRGGQVHNQAVKGKQLGEFTLQWEEADWPFLKRLASRWQSFLVVDDTADSPELSFGLPVAAGSVKSLPDALPYLTGKDFAGRTKSADDGFELQSDAVFYQVESGQSYPLGSKVKFKDQELVVARSTAQLKDGHLLYAYKLYPSSALHQKPLWNPNLTGAAIKGKVIDVAKDKVRVQLEIDTQQDKSTAWWFPYASFYTAEGHSGFYCMPQTGDQVLINLPNCHEAEAIATASIRQGGASCAKTQDPGVKYWGTDQGKELKLGGNELTLTAKDQETGKIQITLNDEDGIEIRSDNEIYLGARKDFSLELEKNASIKAKQEIQLVCGESSIDMDGVTHFKGVEVNLETR